MKLKTRTQLTRISPKLLTSLVSPTSTICSSLVEIGGKVSFDSCVSTSLFLLFEVPPILRVHKIRWRLILASISHSRESLDLILTMLTPLGELTDIFVLRSPYLSPSLSAILYNFSDPKIFEYASVVWCHCHAVESV